MSPEGRDLALLCRHLAGNKKGIDPLVLDLRKVGGPADFFVIVSAENEPQLKAIAGEIERGVGEAGRKVFRSSGQASSQWMILDYGDVLVHVMHSNRRNFYRLENLWGDADQVLN
ncbi:MAG: ribosome silencing factor [Verrucomicrobia bacterium]|nr:ribosome silencing factor [Pseudomonadota bacterium]NBS06938.1 ribosome silencing factor [Verrucomicrobiota bacterium]NBS80159.1 ribosome silencing factor [bacterium]NBS50367.1 ribosome silencing factor [Verrucomicrobiota bacterium]NBT24769.1 ribosome silencing factor [bacterium]